MRRQISSLILLLATAGLFTSCLKTDEVEMTLYDDAALTDFHIASAKVLKHATSSKGEDSTYYITDPTVKYYPFVIDQLNGTVTNTDSLPVGTDVTRLLVSCSSKSTGMIYIENARRDSMALISSTDSIDFTEDRYLRVFSTSGKYSRTYRVKVNVHKEDGGEFVWRRMADNSNIASMTAVKAVELGGSMLVVGVSAEGTVLASTPLADGNAWTVTATSLGTAAYDNMTVRNDTLFVLDGGDMKYSTDGIAFATLAPAPGVKRIFGNSRHEIYGLADNGAIIVSRDGGKTWTPDALGDDSSTLPATELTCSTAPYGFVENTDYVVLAGSRSMEECPQDSNAVVWRKVVDYGKDAAGNKWVYIPVDDRSTYPLHRMKGLTVVSYDASLLALGMEGIGAAKDRAFERIWQSRDGGITWKKNNVYNLPDGFDKTATAFAMTVDSNNNIWLFCAATGQVWKGRLNRLGWQDKQ